MQLDKHGIVGNSCCSNIYRNARYGLTKLLGTILSIFENCMPYFKRILKYFYYYTLSVAIHFQQTIFKDAPEHEMTMKI